MVKARFPSEGWVRPPQSPRELQLAIQRGLGRGLLWARHHQRGKWFEAIRKGVLYTGYDSLTDARSLYFAEIVQGLTDASPILDRLEAGIIESRREVVRYRLYYLLYELACRDFADVKERFRRTLAKAPPTEYSFQLDDVIWVLGWSGLSDWLDSPATALLMPYHIREVADRYGFDPFLAALDKHEYHTVAQHVRGVLTTPPELPSPREKRHVPSGTEISRLTDEILSTRNSERARKIALLLRRAKQFPATPTQVEAAPGFTRPAIRWSLTRLLEFADPKACRAWGRENADQYPMEALRLLASSGRAADWSLVERLASSFRRPTAYSDHDELAGILLKGFCERKLNRRMAPVLLQRYEEGFCAICRHGFLELLESLGAVPPEVRAEYRWDAYELDLRSESIVRQTRDAFGWK